jgi:hypothetical protein
MNVCYQLEEFTFVQLLLFNYSKINLPYEMALY